MTAFLERLRHPWVVRAAQLFTGLLFIAAALPKLGDLRSFADSVHNYRMIPIALENLLAMSLPWIELVAGLALVLGIRSRAGAVLATAMMAVFTVAVGQALARGLDFECGCFGTGDGATVGLKKLAQNLVFTLVAAWAAVKPGD